jgi:hypothetical protein
MKLPFHRTLFRFLIKKTALQRPPDFIVGGTDRPYLHRWHVIPRNRLFNIYFHNFLRSDDDRALHDHPFVNLSIILDGCYVEHTAHDQELLLEGQVKFRSSGKFAHRIELRFGVCWTLFITGPRYRNWGFNCVDSLGYQKWVPWQEFVDDQDRGLIGRGCE